MSGGDTRPKSALNADERRTRQSSLVHEYLYATEAYHYLTIVVDRFRGLLIEEEDESWYWQVQQVRDWLIAQQDIRRKKLVEYFREPE